MSIVVTEKPDSRQTTDGRDIELQYIITGTDDDAAAMDALKTHAPPTHNSMSRRKCRIEPVSIDTANPDKCIWDGMQSGDIIGPWIFKDLQEAFKRLIWTRGGAYWNQVREYKGYGEDNWYPYEWSAAKSAGSKQPSASRK